jgi:two-component system NtrC family sensor kinase
MLSLLQNLRQASDAFIDLGFLDERGIQIGYAGPFPFLQDQSYGEQNWYTRLMGSQVHHHISDIYLGFRNKLHFTIAVKQIINAKAYVFKTTLDPDKFDLYLKTIFQGKGIESAIINDAGEYQVVDPAHRQRPQKTTYIPPMEPPSNAFETRQENRPVLLAYAWLTEVRWALLVTEPLEIAYAQLYQLRRVMLVISALVVVTAISLIWFSTRYLTKKLRHTEAQREEAHHQFLHASKLASLGELATGVAHEINNPLAIIMSTTGVLRDMHNPEFKLDHSPDAVLAELKTIDQAVIRAKAITGQMLSYGRKIAPSLRPANLNEILEDLLGGYKGRELYLAQIDVEKHFAADLPAVMVDADQVRQVFLNLLNNAGDAINGPGRVTVATAAADQAVTVSITDTGAGMPASRIKKIFDPFFTTKEVGKGTGLGLSVSLGIVESMGGSIDVQSMPGAGSTFSVHFPLPPETGRTEE